ncbi:MAG: hypothetical protein VB143_01835 [Burkholderia sp.]
MQDRVDASTRSNPVTGFRWRVFLCVHREANLVNRLRFFWTQIWGKTCVWKRS